jgi:hypothetical protein
VPAYRRPALRILKDLDIVFPQAQTPQLFPHKLELPRTAIRYEYQGR